jgi:hypothetical protein
VQHPRNTEKHISGLGRKTVETGIKKPGAGVNANGSESLFYRVKRYRRIGIFLAPILNFVLFHC